MLHTKIDQVKIVIEKTLIDKLENESTRVHALRAYEQIINSDYNLNTSRQIIIDSIIPFIKMSQS